jgi:hypothetical protein
MSLGGVMRKSRFSEEQIIGVLPRLDVEGSSPFTRSTVTIFWCKSYMREGECSNVTGRRGGIFGDG